MQCNFHPEFCLLDGCAGHQVWHSMQRQALAWLGVGQLQRQATLWRGLLQSAPHTSLLAAILSPQSLACPKPFSTTADGFDMEDTSLSAESLAAASSSSAASSANFAALTPRAVVAKLDQFIVSDFTLCGLQGGMVWKKVRLTYFHSHSRCRPGCMLYACCFSGCLIKWGILIQLVHSGHRRTRISSYHHQGMSRGLAPTFHPLL